MDQHTMPILRNPDQTIPSFRELDENVKAQIREDHKSRLLHNEDNTANGSSASPSPYPPYPARGWGVSPDPSQNAYLKPGFTSQGVFTDELHSHMGSVALRGGPPVVNLPLRQKAYQLSPSPMQTLRACGPRILQERAVPNVIDNSPRSPKKPSVSPCSSATEKLAAPPRAIRQMAPQQSDQTRKQKVQESLQRRPPAQSHRARLQKIGVQFSEVAAHTAKCDECNRRNQNGMSRCKQCGWQICSQCKNGRSGDQSHASFGSIHVPEIGGDVPLDGAQDRRPSISNPEMLAAQALLDLASGATRTLSAGGWVIGHASRLDMTLSSVRSQEFEQQADTLSTDSDATMSMAGDDEWPNDEPELTIDDDGLLMGYVIARRNPARAARPSSKMTE